MRASRYFYASKEFSFYIVYFCWLVQQFCSPSFLPKANCVLGSSNSSAYCGGKSVFDRRHWLLYRSVQSRLGGSRRGDSSGNKGLDGKKKKKSVQAASWTKAQIWWSRLGLTTWATSRGGTRKKKIGAVRMSMPQWRPGIKKEEEKE